MNDLKILAKQQAAQAPGQNFYVTKRGIKRDFNLFGAKYEFKIYNKEGVYVENSKGEIVEAPISQDLRNATDDKTHQRSDEPKRRSRTSNS